MTAPTPPAQPAVAPTPVAPVADPTPTPVVTAPIPTAPVVVGNTGKKSGTAHRTPVVTKGKTEPKAGKGSAVPAAGSASEPGGDLFIKRQ